jgi:hypothetical protein
MCSVLGELTKASVGEEREANSCRDVPENIRLESEQ